MRIIGPRKSIEEVEYALVFDWRDSPGSGFSFPCNERGVVDDTALATAGREKLRQWLDGTYDVVALGVREYRHRYHQPAVGECVCGARVELDGFTNTCDRCGRDYNASGQLLAPRECWGEETGESLADILRIP